MVASGKRGRLNIPARDELRDPLLSVLTLVLIFLIFVIVPLHAAGTIEFKGYGFFIVLLLASCVLMQSTRWAVLLFLSLGLGLAAAGAVLRSRSLSPLDLYLDSIAWVIIGATLILVITGAVFAPGRVTYHRVNGAVLLYLTIGTTFVGFYTLAALRSPLAFSGLTISDHKEFASSVIYFSFVTLTSVGYGDIVPVHPVARALANLEGIIGQLFPATLLARMVTLELEDRRDRRREKD
jgi:hypothetical protein